MNPDRCLCACGEAKSGFRGEPLPADAPHPLRPADDHVDGAQEAVCRADRPGPLRQRGGGGDRTLIPFLNKTRFQTRVMRDRVDSSFRAACGKVGNPLRTSQARRDPCAMIGIRSTWRVAALRLGVRKVAKEVQYEMIAGTALQTGTDAAQIVERWNQAKSSDELAEVIPPLTSVRL